MRFLKLFRHSDKYVSQMFYSTVSPVVIRTPNQILNVRFSTNFKRDRQVLKRNDFEIARTLISHKHLRLIKKTIREYGPIENNQKLATIIKNAKQILSPEYINFAKRISCDTRAISGLYDLFFSGGCHLVIQYEDIDQTVTKSHLLNLCDKHDGNLIQGQMKWSQTFNQKGIITLRCHETDPFFQHPKETLLSTIKAESFHKETDADGHNYWKVFCDPWKLHDVKKEINKISENIEEAYVGFLPIQLINLPPYMKTNICNIFVELSKVPTIDNVYANVNVLK